MSFALADSAACFKYFRGIWVVNKARGWETTVCVQLLQLLPELAELSAVCELSTCKLNKLLCVMCCS